VNLLVKYAEIFSPRVAISAISSAVGAAGFALDIFGIDSFFLSSRSPGRNQMVVLTIRIISDFEDDRTQGIAAPTYCAELFRIIAPLVHQVSLVKDLLRLFEANAVSSLYLTAFPAVKIEARI
jgi:hypothetical protein